MNVQNQPRSTIGAAASSSLVAAGTGLRASDAGRGAGPPSGGAADQARLAVQLRKVASALEQLSRSLTIGGGGSPAQACAAHAMDTGATQGKTGRNDADRAKGATGAPGLERVLQRDTDKRSSKHAHAQHAAHEKPKDAAPTQTMMLNPPSPLPRRFGQGGLIPMTRKSGEPRCVFVRGTTSTT